MAAVFNPNPPAETQRGASMAKYIAGTLQRRFPPEVLEAAQRALVDIIGLMVGASSDPVARPVRATIRHWHATGKARIVMGGTTTPALAVLANGTMGHAMDKVLGLSFQRIQFTSDLLPGDILGTSVFDKESGQFVFHPGPVFAELVLADEINRATPKSQSALLEAME